MAKKRVKVAKYTKEKNAKAWEDYRAQQAKLTYSIWENMGYILREAWEHAPGMIWCLAILLFAQTAENLCEAYTDKYIVALALGESARVPLAVISLLLIFGTRFFRFLAAQASGFGDYMGKFPFVMTTFHFGENRHFEMALTPTKRSPPHRGRTAAGSHRLDGGRPHRDAIQPSRL